MRLVHLKDTCTHTPCTYTQTCTCARANHLAIPSCAPSMCEARVSSRVHACRVCRVHACRVTVWLTLTIVCLWASVCLSACLWLFVCPCLSLHPCTSIHAPTHPRTNASTHPRTHARTVIRRFTRRILIPLPDAAARQALVDHLLKGQRRSTTQSDMIRLTKETEGYSASDLRAVCNHAAMSPIRELGSRVAQVRVPPCMCACLRACLRACCGCVCG
jgi:hypothetical protein